MVARRGVLAGLAGAVGLSAVGVAGAAPAVAAVPVTGVSPSEFGPFTLGAGVSAVVAEANRAALQAAFDASSMSGLPVVLPAGVFVAPGVKGRAGVWVSGNGATWAGLAGVPALILEPDHNGGWYERVNFAGDGGPAVEKTGAGQAPTYVYWMDCTFTAYGQSAFKWSGAGSEQFWYRCTFQGGQAGVGFELDFPTQAGAADGFEFHHCQFGGRNFARIVTRNSSGWWFDHCFGNNTVEHGWVIDNRGGITRWSFTNCYASELMCTSGRADRVVTSGSTTAGSAVVTVAQVVNGSGGGFKPGQLVTVERAGAYGALLSGRVLAVDGSAVTLDVTAGVSVSGAWVTNAEFDVIHNVGGPLVATMRDCEFYSGSGSNARFGVFNSAGVSMYDTVAPSYDQYLSGSFVRSTAPITWPTAKGQSSGRLVGPSGQTGLLPVWTAERSASGGDHVLSLAPGGPNYTGPWGKFRLFRWQAGGGVERFTVDADGAMTTGRGATTARPSAAVAGVGAQWFDSTLKRPIWSDGQVWRDAAGNAV